MGLMRKYCSLNSMNKILFLLIFNFLLSNNTAWCQEIKVVRDFGVWAGISFEKKVFTDLNFKLEHQFRTFGNASQLDDYLFDARLKYPINKHFILGSNIRYIHNIKRLERTENNIRCNIDIEYQKKVYQNIKIRYRLRYQQEFINAHLFFFRNGQQTVTNSAIRNKLKLFFKYNTRNNIYTSIEIFRLIQVFREPYFSKIRLFIGNQFNNKFDFSIGFEKEIGSNHPYSFIFFKTIYRMKR